MQNTTLAYKNYILLHIKKDEKFSHLNFLYIPLGVWCIIIYAQISPCSTILM